MGRISPQLTGPKRGGVMTSVRVWWPPKRFIAEMILLGLVTSIRASLDFHGRRSA